MTKESIREVTIGGLLHDLGKIKVQVQLLTKWAID
ncbi:hypothetical protein M918_22550 [Clostridium sp. BL8]|nr:hypothetical protein M918_22550 [Clostridium sp. BL8]